MESSESSPPHTPSDSCCTWVTELQASCCGVGVVLETEPSTKNPEVWSSSSLTPSFHWSGEREAGPQHQASQDVAWSTANCHCHCQHINNFKTNAETFRIICFKCMWRLEFFFKRFTSFKNNVRINVSPTYWSQENFLCGHQCEEIIN